HLHPRLLRGVAAEQVHVRQALEQGLPENLTKLLAGRLAVFSLDGVKRARQKLTVARQLPDWRKQLGSVLAACFLDCELARHIRLKLRPFRHQFVAHAPPSDSCVSRRTNPE